MRNPRRQSPSFDKYFAGFFRRPLLLGLALLVLTLTGCSFLRIPGSQPKAQVDSLQLIGKPTGQVTMVVLQAQVMRFADTYSATVAQACDDVTATTTNMFLRETVLRWKLGQSTAAFVNATGQNPAVNALDMLVLVSMGRMVVEDYGVDTFGDAITPLLIAQRNLETNAWTMASGVLKPSQQQELRGLIQEWRVKNPHQRYVGPIRFREFVTALGKTPTQATTAPTSIFSLLYLDPLAGLDPTAAAIQETREMGERAMYYTQRMPMLLSWQVELLAYRLAGQPESEQILNDANRMAAAAETFAKSAQQIPQLVTDSHATVDSVSDAAKNINAAIQSLTTFVQYVSPTNAPTASGTNSAPFNVLDYGTAAAQIGAAADHLNALLTTVNQTTPQLAQLGQSSAAKADEVVNRAFRYGLILIVVLLVGAVLAGLFYRAVTNKLNSSPRKSSGD